MEKWVDQGKRLLEFQPRDKMLNKLQTDQLWYRGDKDMRLEWKYKGPYQVIKKAGRASNKIDIPT